MRGIVKRFPGVVAVDHVDLDVYGGEVLALLGENGAGKTTLMNILYGLYRPDEGEIYIEGKKVTLRSPRDAIMHGIGMVHQHFTLVDDLTIVENVILGLKEYGIILDFKKASRRIMEIAEQVGFKINPQQKIWQLSAGEKQRVEILKALFRNIKVLILDEPTSVLTPQETKELFKIIRYLTSRGLAVIFISHKLQEVMEIADRIVVLRRGKVVGRLSKSEASTPLLARLMVGREVFLRYEKPETKPGDIILEVIGLGALSDKGVPALKNVTFKVRRGEIIGVAGVAGNGQRELAEVLYGVRKATSGRVLFNGRDITSLSVADRIKLGISLIPEERLRVGVASSMSVAENLVLKSVDNPPFSTPLIPVAKALNLRKLNLDAIKSHAEKLVSEFQINTPSIEARAYMLSGGNIQRLILARELSSKPLLLIAEEPTAGLDIAATEFIHRLLLDFKKENHSVILISGDLSEVLSLSDKVMVMYEGEIVGVFKPGEVSLEDIGLMMTGGSKMPKEVVMKFWD